ncbi:MAG: dihydrodipicolinate synthase family protein [Candidatus Poribacteria bacterium]|nr:MAG: dihydrodipicolinate synthase family protein [Candidatus Poribacteria bacterium]
MTCALGGIVPPVVTPFDASGELDISALQKEIVHLLQAGVHGIAVCGSTGEGHTLTVEETRRIATLAVREAGDAVPVIVGVIADSTRAVVERGRAVADLGVTALQVTPVHYLFRPDDAAMTAFFATIAEQTGLPVIVYNVVPWAYLSPTFLARLIAEVPGVVGVKQSAGDLKLLADLLLLLKGQGTVFSAVDALLYPSFAIGAHGAIAAILSAVPELCLQLWDAVRKGDHQAARSLHERLLVLWNALEGDNLPANVKCAMAFQGREGGKPRAPMPETSRAQAQRIYDALIHAGISPVVPRP